MEVKYLWIDSYHNLEEVDLNFSHLGTHRYHYDGDQIHLSENIHAPLNFGDKVSSVTGEGLKAIAKLSSLADEFPWFKQGVLGFVSAIEQLRLQKGDPALMQEDMERMERYIQSWGT